MITLGDDGPIIVEVDPEVRDLIPAYLENRGRDLERMRAAAARGDFETILSLAHNMQGSGGSFGFADLSEIGGELERAARSRTRSGIEEELARLERYLSRVALPDAAREAAAADTEPAAGGAAPATVTALPRARTGAGAILLVDDQEMNATLMGRYLERDGYSVTWVASGEAALAALAQSAPPALILLDVVMPGMSGFEVCRRIKSNGATCGIPVVLITTFDRRSEFLQAWAAGADDVLARPVRRDDLLRRVRSLADSARHAAGWRADR